MQNADDAELVSRARAGDKHAMGDLITRHYATAERAARRMIGDGELARDLAQEAMLAAYLSLENLRDEARFGSWLYGIVLNVCRSHVRSRKDAAFWPEQAAGGIAFERLPFHAEPDPQEQAETRELHELVLGAVEALSPENRAATLLFYYDSLTLDEIAAALNISVTAVKGRLHKSRRALKKQLFAAHAEYVPERAAHPRRRRMISVTVADVVRRENTDAEGQSFPMNVVVLHDAAHQRALPIWVGPFEGMAIAVGVEGIPLQRPLTYEFTSKLLDAVEAQVESVRIESLREDVFYAVVSVRQGGTAREIDARPSDAIALAMRTHSPIYVADEIMDRAGMSVPATTTPTPPRGANQMVREWQAEMQKARAMMTPNEQEMEQSQKELVVLVFGN